MTSVPAFLFSRFLILIHVYAILHVYTKIRCFLAPIFRIYSTRFTVFHREQQNTTLMTCTIYLDNLIKTGGREPICVQSCDFPFFEKFQKGQNNPNFSNKLDW